MTVFEPREALEILERTPGTLRAMLGGISDTWARSRQENNSWCPIDIVGHLIHGERTDWITRAHTILEEGEETPFTPFDRNGHVQILVGKNLEELLDEFAGLRAQNLQTLQAMEVTPEKLRLKGTHPTLGPVSLEQLLSTWTVHDLNHISQITRALAARYRDNVGPWNKLDYLRVLQRA